jgi:hypothetical protein
MEMVLPVLAVASGSVFVWLTVRVVNQRERWAKWTAVALVAAVVGYPLSFGPACRLIEEGYLPINSPWICIYCPLTRLASSTKPSFAKDTLCRWASACDGDIGLVLLVFTSDPD